MSRAVTAARFVAVMSELRDLDRTAYDEVMAEARRMVAERHQRKSTKQRERWNRRAS